MASRIYFLGRDRCWMHRRTDASISDGRCMGSSNSACTRSRYAHFTADRFAVYSAGDRFLSPHILRMAPPAVYGPCNGTAWNLYDPVGVDPSIRDLLRHMGGDGVPAQWMVGQAGRDCNR